MATLKPKEVGHLLQKRQNKFAYYLVYGADSFRVKETCKTLAAQVVPDLCDPFNTVTLTDANLKETPSVLADECFALSLMNSERVVTVHTSGEKCVPALKHLQSALHHTNAKPNSLILLATGALAKRSTIRKLVESCRYGATIPCYPGTLTDIEAMVSKMLDQAGLTLALGAQEELLARLTSDNTNIDLGIARTELDKLITYMGINPSSPSNDTSISATHIKECFAETNTDAALQLSKLTAGGHITKLVQALTHAQQAGAHPVMILRNLQRVFLRLYTAQTYIADGHPPKVAMKKLKPPVFFTEERDFLMHLQIWSLPALHRVMSQLTQAEIDTKTTGFPAAEIMERTLLRLATMAKRPKENRPS